MSAVAMRSASDFFLPVGTLTKQLRSCAYVLSGVLLTAVSVRAEAPAPSQEFWNYFVEFGDAQGELFDPSDYAALANLPAKAKQEIDNASNVSKPEQVPHESRATQERSQ